MIEFFEQNPTESNSRLKPFIEDYAESHPNDLRTHQVISVTRTRKRTGYLLDTEVFTIMLFEGSKLLQHLLDALAVWHTSGHGYKLVVQVTEQYPFYKLGTDFDQPCNWYASKGKYFTASESITTTSGLLDSQNPLLPRPSTGKHKRKSTQTIHTENQSSDA